MRALRIVVVGCILSVLGYSLAGCGRGAGTEGEILVSIGSTHITVDDFNERVASLPERYREVVKRRKAAYIQELINDTLLYQQALRMGLDRDEDVKKVLEEAKKKILIAKLLENEIESAIDTTEEEIASYYEDNRSRYTMPEIMRASHILVNSIDGARAILEELQRGVLFEEAARARSLDPTAQKGGDIGYFPKGQLMPEFEQACSRLSVGETSDVVRTSLGYHIIKLTDRRPPTERPIEDVREEISLRIRENKRRERFNDLLAQLKSSTEINVNEEALSDRGSTEKAEKIEK
jgi:peptidyl-prolyl cis-trans isomerase C